MPIWHNMATSWSSYLNTRARRTLSVFAVVAIYGASLGMLTFAQLTLDRMAARVQPSVPSFDASATSHAPVRVVTPLNTFVTPKSRDEAAFDLQPR